MGSTAADHPSFFGAKCCQQLSNLCFVGWARPTCRLSLRVRVSPFRTILSSFEEILISCPRSLVPAQ